MRTILMMTLALAGCSANTVSKPAPASLETGSVDQHIDPWQLSCSNDNHGTAPRSCTLARADAGGLVQVMFVDRKGPYLFVGSPTYPGKPNPARVDNGPVLEASKNGPALVQSALTGRKLYGSYYMWPNSGVLVTEVDLDGFAEAYAKLKGML